MERSLVKIALSPQQEAKLKGQEILVYNQRLWLWIEVLFLPLMLIVYVGYILPFKNTFTIFSFGLVILILLVPFLNARKRLKINPPVLRMNSKNLSFHTTQIHWSDIEKGSIVTGLFGDEMNIYTRQGNEYKISLMHLTRTTSQIHVLMCKYYSLYQ